MKKLALCFITETKLRKPSGVPCRGSVAGDTAWQQTLSLGLKRKLLRSPAQVASLSVLDTVLQVSSFHDNFKEVNVIVKYMKMPNSKNSQKFHEAE